MSAKKRKKIDERTEDDFAIARETMELPSVNEETELIQVPDGFVPSSCEKSTTTRVFNARCGKGGDPFVEIVRNALPKALAIRAYEYTSKKKVPWGSYVHVKDLVQDDAKKLSPVEQKKTEDDEIENERRLAHDIVEALFFRDSTSRPAKRFAKDASDAHGFAVWCLASTISKEVTYHLDYAEQYRMLTNIIWPPMIGTVCNITPIEHESQIDTVLAINLDGIDHYAKYGHRLALASASALEADLRTNSKHWVRVPYRFNQAILFEGNLPHLSTKLTKIPSHLKRVIIGINVFDRRIGPTAAKCTIHSAAWRRAQRLYAMTKTESGEEKVRIADIRKKNPFLFKLLAAKRDRARAKRMREALEASQRAARAAFDAGETSAEALLRRYFPKTWLMISCKKKNREANDDKSRLVVNEHYLRSWLRHRGVREMPDGAASGECIALVLRLSMGPHAPSSTSEES